MKRFLLLFVLLVLIAIVLKQIYSPIPLQESYKQIENPRIVCLYAYYEKNDEYKENFKYFLKRGILKNVKYYIVVNGECSIDIPEWGNVTVLRRPNKGYDFAAYAYAINKLEDEFDYYFFLNTSVKGPFYPASVNPKWVDYFLPLFSKDTKLVGTAINIYTITQHNDYNLERIYGHKAPFTHLQTMFFGMDRELFEYLDYISFFSEVELELKAIEYVIVFKEIGLTQKVLAKGWNINCILPEYKDLDYRTLKEDINPTSLNGEMYYHGRYFGNTVKPEQVIFYKGYRLSELDKNANQNSGEDKKSDSGTESKGI